jgi:hypothetical protein
LLLGTGSFEYQRSELGDPLVVRFENFHCRIIWAAEAHHPL